MAKKSYIYYPLILAFAIFTLDKFALIPVIRDYGRPEMTPIENILNNLANIIHDDKKNTILLLGTSRTDVFESLHPDEIKKNSYVSAGEKKILLNQYYETRAVVKASELLITFASIRQVIDEGHAPALIVAEVSPEMFNANSPANLMTRFSQNIYPFSLTWDIAKVTTGEIQKEAVYRLLFASYAYRFRPEKAISHLFKSKKISSDNLVLYMLSQSPNVQRIPGDFVDFEANNIPENEYKKRFLGYTNYLRKKNIMRDYRYEPNELHILERIIQLTAENNISLVLWLPPVHPVLARHHTESEYGQHRSEILSLIKKYDVPYFDGQKSTLKCNRFVDSSHLSPRCGSWLMSRILNAACEGGMDDYCAR